MPVNSIQMDLTNVGVLNESNALFNSREELEARFQAEGYLFLRDVLDRKEVERVKSDFIGVLQRQGVVTPAVMEPIWTGADLDQIDDDELYALDSHDRILASPRLTGIMERFFGEPVFRYRNTDIRFALPQDLVHMTPPHQDHFFIRHTPEFRTAWIPLMHVEPAMGGLALAERSHLGGLRDHVEHETAVSYIFRGRRQRGVPLDRIEQRWLTAEYRPGDLLLFHSMTIHRAFPNHSDRIRLSLDTRFQPARLPRNWQAERTILEMRQYRKQAASVAADAGMGEEPFENLLIEMMKRGVKPEREPMLALAAELQ